MAENIFFELSIVLAIATFASMFMKSIKQPLIIGYIISGIIAGPFVLDIFVTEATASAITAVVLNNAQPVKNATFGTKQAPSQTAPTATVKSAIGSVIMSIIMFIKRSKNCENGRAAHIWPTTYWHIKY